MHRVHQTTVLTLTAFVLTGCQVGYFHAETTWNDDGSIKREVLQPRDRMADGVESGDAWNEVRFASEPDAEFHGPIADVSENEDGTYFAGSTEAADVASLPEHYRKIAGDEQFESRLVRSAERTDYGLVVEYVWDEKLTEVVRLQDLRKAIVEATDIGGDATSGVLQQVLGDGYDTSQLNVWITTEGREWVLEMVDVFYDAAVRREKDDKPILAALNAICARRGLNVTLMSDWDADDEAELARFLTELFRKTVRTANGGEVDAQTIDLLRRAVHSEGEAPDVKEFVDRCKLAAEDYQQAWPGGKAAFEAKMKNLQARVLGVHGLIFGSPERFRYRMQLPGEIVETNGRLVDSDSVEWQFSLGDVWPAGYAMRVRSLHDQTAPLSGSLTKHFSATRFSLLKLVETIGSDEKLRKALIACREQQSAAPLSALRDRVTIDDATYKRIAELSQLLRLESE